MRAISNNSCPPALFNWIFVSKNARMQLCSHVLLKTPPHKQNGMDDFVQYLFKGGSPFGLTSIYTLLNRVVLGWRAQMEEIENKLPVLVRGRVTRFLKHTVLFRHCLPTK